MSVLIGNASIDEWGHISGGQPGDQTGKEVVVREYTNIGWTEVLRPLDPALAERIATCMEQACANDHIGYDQNERYSLYNALKQVDWDFTKIATDCECDCSSLVTDILIANGISVSKFLYTGNMVSAIMNTGKFEMFRDPAYIEHDNLLKRGDILVKQHYHTAVVLTNGEDAVPDDGIRFVDTDELNLRDKPNMASQINGTMPFRARVEVLAEEGEWSLVKVEGYCATGYLSKAEPKQTYTTTDNLNLRLTPGLGSCIILTIPKGQKVENLGNTERADGVMWRNVRYVTSCGWVSGEYLA